MSTIASVSEEALIQLLAPPEDPCVPSPPEGPGDDAAILPPSPLPQIVTTDGVVRGVHFAENDDPRLVGAKLANRNLSDLAAMGARPRCAFLSVSVGPDCPLAWWKDFGNGLRQALQAAGATLNGGDVTGAPAASFCAFLTLIGESARPVRRHQAVAGCRVWVTGTLGNSLQSGHHLRFSPRWREGLWLGASNEVISMLDVSDGLSKELPLLTRPGFDCAINPAALPLREGLNPQEWPRALSDGEDHELLFATRPETDKTRFAEEWARHFSLTLTPIGTIVDGEGNGPAILDERTGERITVEGFRHWKASS